MATEILIVQNHHDLRWDYGPEHLLKILQLDYEGGTFATAEHAKEAARKDRAIHRPLRFTEVWAPPAKRR